MEEKIWLSSPHFEGTEGALLQEVLMPQGGGEQLYAQLPKFEKQLEELLGVPAIALNSGTSALHLALRLLGVEKGDEVLCPTFTFSAAVNPILYQGAKPVFIDSEQETWNMCPELLREAILDRRSKGGKLKAIMLVHNYGVPGKLDELFEVAEEFDLPVIEDAAEALGGKYDGKPLGAFGRMGILSFNLNKIITATGGGALVSENKDLLAQGLHLATQAKDGSGHYQHSTLGFNYRMSPLLAALGGAQLKMLEQRVEKRRQLFKEYQASLETVEGLTFQQEEKKACSNRWLTCLKLPNGIAPVQVLQQMAARGVELKQLWKPMHQQPVFEGFPSYLNGVSQNLFEQGLCLPSSSSLTTGQMTKVTQYLHELVG